MPACIIQATGGLVHRIAGLDPAGRSAFRHANLSPAGRPAHPLAKYVAERCPWLVAEEPHEGLPIGRPPLVLDQRSRLAEREVEAAEPLAGLTEQGVERVERLEFADLLDAVDRIARAADETSHGDRQRLPRPRRRGEVDAEHDRPAGAGCGGHPTITVGRRAGSGIALSSRSTTRLGTSPWPKST